MVQGGIEVGVDMVTQHAGKRPAGEAELNRLPRRKCETSTKGRCGAPSQTAFVEGASRQQNASVRCGLVRRLGRKSETATKSRCGVPSLKMNKAFV